MTNPGWTRRGLMASGAALALTAAACGRKNEGVTRVAKGDARTLHRGNGAEPDTIDPHKASGNWENNIIGDMFIGLMTDAADATAIYGAAESMTASADGLVYTFKLRDHVWSDGKPVTAHDFVFSYRRMADPKTAAQYASILYPMKNMQKATEGKVAPSEVGARAIDDRTLELTFDYQVPYLKEMLTHYTCFAVPQHIVEKHGEQWTRPENIVCNGPYMLKEWISNDHLRLVKNPKFYDAANVHIDTVNFYPTQDSSAALKRFRGGEFDIVTDSVPPAEINWLKTNMPRELRLSPYILSQYVQFNMSRKPFTDPRIRKAMSLALDREVLVSRILRAGELASYSLVPKGIPGYQSAELAFRKEPMEKRLAEAAQLLAAAGYGPNNPLNFSFNVSNATETRAVSVAMQGMWSKLSINAKIDNYDSQIHYNMLRKRDFEVTWAGWIADYRDAKNYLMLFQSGTTDLNYSGYSNPAYDALVDKSDNEHDPAAREVLLRQAEQLLLDDAVVIPGYQGVTRNLVSPQVQGWADNNVNIHRTRHLRLDRERTV